MNPPTTILYFNGHEISIEPFLKWFQKELYMNVNRHFVRTTMCEASIYKDLLSQPFIPREGEISISPRNHFSFSDFLDLKNSLPSNQNQISIDTKITFFEAILNDLPIFSKGSETGSKQKAKLEFHTIQYSLALSHKNPIRI